MMMMMIGDDDANSDDDYYFGDRSDDHAHCYSDQMGLRRPSGLPGIYYQRRTSLIRRTRVRHPGYDHYSEQSDHVLLIMIFIDLISRHDVKYSNGDPENL